MEKGDQNDSFSYDPERRETLPTVASFGGGKFVIHTNDHPPPHVHVYLNDGSEYRRNLISGDFMDGTPPSGIRKKIMKAYNENIDRIWNEWERMHPSNSLSGDDKR